MRAGEIEVRLWGAWVQLLLDEPWLERTLKSCIVQQTRSFFIEAGREWAPRRARVWLSILKSNEALCATSSESPTKRRKCFMTKLHSLPFAIILFKKCHHSLLIAYLVDFPRLWMHPFLRLDV